MASPDPVILALTSYEKGHEFLREAAGHARTFLMTVDSLRDAPWPRDVLADVLVMPSFDVPEHVVNAVSYLARTENIDRIVALDEFDMELAAALREHLRVPGLRITETHGVRDKLAMRELADAAGIRVPPFVGVTGHERLARFMERVPPPWVLKPRTQASAIGIRKLHRNEELWPLLDELGDRQSHHLLEQFIPGDVFHVDAIVSNGAVVFAEAHRYAQPPFEVMHDGGIFCTATVQRGSELEAILLHELRRLVAAVSLRNSVVHAEFIRAHDTGDIHFLEIAARVGGAFIAETVEAATGVNLWREWARLELALATGGAYAPAPTHAAHAGVLISLARQEWPDLAAYTDSEIVHRVHRRHHAGLIVASDSHDRVQELLAGYMHRFREDFFARLPAPEKATN